MQPEDQLANPHTWQDYTDRARGLMTALHQLEQEQDRKFSKCSAVIQRFLENENQLTQAIESTIADEFVEPDRIVYDAYHVILGLYHDQTNYRMLGGRGNFGTPSRGYPPALPMFTEIRLTQRAQKMISEQ